MSFPDLKWEFMGLKQVELFYYSEIVSFRSL